MNNLMQTTSSVLVTIACLYGVNVLADQLSYDYTGTSTIQSTVGRDLEAENFASDPIQGEISAKSPVCEEVEDHFDYSGTQQVRCSVDWMPQEAEWSYLY